PRLLLVCAKYVRSRSRYSDRGSLSAVLDATIACTSTMLAAHARHLRSCWVGAFDEDRVRGILSLPSHIRPVAILCIGKGNLPRELTDRLPVSEHLHHETW
ncbi:MAG: nitroreductase, partial [Methanoregulaceae archaeon]|nr:nitroreductase [Methanoregulaceae archaeon]